MYFLSQWLDDKEITQRLVENKGTGRSTRQEDSFYGGSAQHHTLKVVPLRSESQTGLFPSIQLVLVPDLLDQFPSSLQSCGETIATLADLIPSNQFWRWKEMWSNSLRTAVFVTALLEYLKTGGLISISKVKEMLGS